MLRYKEKFVVVISQFIRYGILILPIFVL